MNKYIIKYLNPTIHSQSTGGEKSTYKYADEIRYQEGAILGLNEYGHVIWVQAHATWLEVGEERSA